MWESLSIFFEYIIMSFGGFFIPIFVSKGIRRVETESTGTALLASVVIGISFSFILVLLFSNIVLFWISATTTTFTLFVIFAFLEKESPARALASLVVAGLFYYFIAWFYLSSPTAILVSMIFFVAGSLASLEESSWITLPIMAFIVAVLTPFLKYIIPSKIISYAIHAILYLLILGVGIRGLERDMGKSSIFSILLLIGISVFFLLSKEIPGLPPEAIQYARVAGGGIEEQITIYQRYLDLYRKMQKNETLRKLYGAGAYELPPEASFIVEPNVGLKITYNPSDVYKYWDTETGEITVEFIGEVSNPLESPVRVLIMPRIEEISYKNGSSLEIVTFDEFEKYVSEIKCDFMKEELEDGFENGDIEIIFGKSSEPFTCTIRFKSIPPEVTEIWFKYFIDVYYDVYASSIVKMHLMGKEKYRSLSRFGKLKEEEIKSYSTWGPLRGVIKIFGYEKNPIPVEKGEEKKLYLYVYTVNSIGRGYADMRCYVLAFPRTNYIEIEEISENCAEIVKGIAGRLEIPKIPRKIRIFYPKEEEQEDFLSLIYRKCEIPITEDESLYYGFTIYKGYFEKIYKDYRLFLCWFDKGFTYKGDPSISDEVKIFQVRIKDFPQDGEKILFPQAHFIYTFHDWKSVFVDIKR